MKSGSRTRWILVFALRTVQAHGGSPSSTAETDARSVATAGVMLPNCPRLGLEQTALFAAIRLEFENDGWSRIVLVDGRDPNASVTVEVTVACSAAANQVLLSTYGSSAQVMHRTMALTDLPHAVRTRAVALAVAEFARSSMSGIAGAETSTSETSTTETSTTETSTTETSTTETSTTETSTTETSTTETSTPEPNESDSDRTGSAKQSKRVDAPSKVIGPAGTLVTRPTDESCAGSHCTKAVGIVALGVTIRGFFPQPTLAYGGRLTFGRGWLRVGLDYLTAGPPASDNPTGFGLIGGSAAAIIISSDYGRWRIVAGPRIMLGKAWSSPLNAAGAAVNQGGIVGTPEKPSSKNSRLYLEGMIHEDTSIRISSGWAVVAGLEAGIAHGIAKEGTTLNAETSATLPAIGACLLVQYEH